jgi:ribonuclease HII
MPQRRLPLRTLEDEARRGSSDPEVYVRLKRILAGDSRAGAAALLRKWESRVSRTVREEARLEKMLIPEREVRTRSGARQVAGVDEAGRGPLAGPVVAAAVVLPEHPDFGLFAGLNDSKQLTEEKREELYLAIQKGALGLGVGFASAREIDEINIREASRRAMERAVMKISPEPEYLLLDAMTIEGFPLERQKGLIHGDALSLSIAAASVIAKVTRDRLMVEIDARYPGYGFARHKGYGTALHLKALKSLGPCPEHRGSFEPVRQLGLDL